MNKLIDKGEIIIYQPDDRSTLLEVRIEDETVWLSQMQMAELFQITRNNVTIHISNIFKEGELDQISVCKDSLLTAQDGKNYKTIILTRVFWLYCQKEILLWRLQYTQRLYQRN